MNKYKELVNKFKDTKVLVIGDLMLDRFIWGNVSRISPEAPVPVVAVTRETFMPGGAGNVAFNISDLGGEAYITGAIGDDIFGKLFIEEMKTKKINIDDIVKFDDRTTIVKTRVIAHNQQVVRVDREIKEGIKKEMIDQMIKSSLALIPSMDAVIISDYGKGVICQRLLKQVITQALKSNKPILVDPKIENFKKYKKVTCITPNLLEAKQGMHYLHAETEEDIKNLGKNILKTLELKSLLITRGEKGMSLFEKNKITNIPTMAKEVYDVTGAGDTVISTLAMCLGNDGNIKDSAIVANYAAGLVVGKLGTATTNQEELLNIIKN